MLKLSFRNQVLVGFAVSIFLVFLVGILSYNSINQLEDDTILVDHTQQVIKSSNSLLQGLIDAETGMRGYGATQKKALLQPYRQALPGINQDLRDLRMLVDDNSEQVDRIDSLNVLVSNQLELMKTNIETRDAKGLEFMVQNNMFLSGKQSMDVIRKV